MKTVINLDILPDILVILLKRFQYTDGNLEKIENLIEFPIDNFDGSSLMFRKNKLK